MEPTWSLSDAELKAEVLTWSVSVAAGEARLLGLIAEFNRREAWFGPRLLSCAHWLVWRTGLSAGTAREKVRVARVRRTEAAAADPERAVWLMRGSKTYDEHGNLRLVLLFPAELGAVVVAGLEQIQADLDRAAWARSTLSGAVSPAAPATGGSMPFTSGSSRTAEAPTWSKASTTPDRAVNRLVDRLRASARLCSQRDS